MLNLHLSNEHYAKVLIKLDNLLSKTLKEVIQQCILEVPLIPKNSIQKPLLGKHFKLRQETNYCIHF